MRTNGEGCKIWTGALNSEGYPVVRQGTKVVLAHRKALGYTGSKTVHHKCNNKRCVNPKHLEVASQKDNIGASSSPAGKNSRKTTCDKGHSLSDAYTFKDADGRTHRQCRQCKQALERISKHLENTPDDHDQSDHAPGSRKSGSGGKSKSSNDKMWITQKMNQFGFERDGELSTQEKAVLGALAVLGTGLIVHQKMDTINLTRTFMGQRNLDKSTLLSDGLLDFPGEYRPDDLNKVFKGQSSTETLTNIENAIRGKKREFIFAVDMDHNSILAGGRGTGGAAAISESSLNSVKDLTARGRNISITHNHPIDLPLSSPDFAFFSDSGVMEMRAVSDTAVYRFQRTGKPADAVLTHAGTLQYNTDILEGIMESGAVQFLAPAPLNPVAMRLTHPKQMEIINRKIDAGWRISAEASNLYTYEKIPNESLQQMVALGKHLEGEHDQEDHGNWARELTGTISSSQKKAMKGLISDPIRPKAISNALNLLKDKAGKSFMAAWIDGEGNALDVTFGAQMRFGSKDTDLPPDKVNMAERLNEFLFPVDQAHHAQLYRTEVPLDRLQRLFTRNKNYDGSSVVIARPDGRLPDGNDLTSALTMGLKGAHYVLPDGSTRGFEFAEDVTREQVKEFKSFMDSARGGVLWRDRIKPTGTKLSDTKDDVKTLRETDPWNPTPASMQARVNLGYDQPRTYEQRKRTVDDAFRHFQHKTKGAVTYYIDGKKATPILSIEKRDQVRELQASLTYWSNVKAVV